MPVKAARAIVRDLGTDTKLTPNFWVGEGHSVTTCYAVQDRDKITVFEVVAFGYNLTVSQIPTR